MSQVKKISIALTKPQINILKNAVNAGEYASTSEIIREALRDWEMKQKLRCDDISRLRQSWDEGIASGKPCELDFEKIRAEGKRRIAALKAVEAV
jgi:antitoxin ParD1/3/4